MSSKSSSSSSEEERHDEKKKKWNEEKTGMALSIPQHGDNEDDNNTTLDVTSRSDMENWVARQEHINRVRRDVFSQTRVKHEEISLHNKINTNTVIRSCS